MKPNFLTNLFAVLTCVGLGGHSSAQTQATSSQTTDLVESGVKFEVLSSQTTTLPGGTGRKMTVERVMPTSIPPEPEVELPPALDPAVRTARMAEWRSKAKVERRVLSLTARYYPNGLTLLHWFAPGPDGQWESYEAWSRTDFRSLWLLPEFETNGTQYSIFPIVIPAGLSHLQRPFPGPLDVPEGLPGFRLTKGDPTRLKSLEAVTELHRIYAKDGPRLTADWESRQVQDEAAAAYQKANPPPVQDIVIRVWPVKSNRYPGAEAQASAAKAAGQVAK